MFFDQQPITLQNDYLELLEIMGSLSNLFSDRSTPYLPYRITENLFCMCLGAKNLSRSDCTADASKDNIGVGIKTFIGGTNDGSMQKIAEFNRKRSEYTSLSNIDLVLAVSTFRNDRINLTKRMHALSDMIYHYTVRNTSKISILECPLETINISAIKLEKSHNMNSIYFNDGQNLYSFNLSKSTLYKKFDTSNIIREINVKIIDNPFLLLKEMLGEKRDKIVFSPIRELPHVFLPLFSTRTGKVPEKSGLNQWNADGRARHSDELYIPVPKNVHKRFPGFFPDRNTIFELELPNGKVLSAKMCQSDSKGLMSNPNKELGHWLLRDVLQIKEGKLVKLEILQKLGIDSAVIYKDSDKHFAIDFTTLGSYDKFISETDEEGE
ncbi:hypothetical protein FACS1894132_04370 [Clostridia bacterium]|nr:hypothetical protein FACS1894132_04370 [Clostridia bacterium]